MRRAAPWQWIARQQPVLLGLVIDPLEELLGHRRAVPEPVHPLGLASELARSDLAQRLARGLRLIGFQAKSADIPYAAVITSY